ncbi:hypothetical protein NXH64_14830 [Butyrivibrio fibrisolvens]|uniref:hypothetical protein n=1 Tax=Pseudobutyrivibrio ruminis TaxID=46206 RepID=UPI00041C4F02|nr:hypothetical protein [Pseudobutyrivibrio ruminis]MDC7280774.1 hypothetical protein [Butyrivibrio fibrisolvens]
MKNTTRDRKFMEFFEKEFANEQGCTLEIDGEIAFVLDRDGYPRILEIEDTTGMVHIRW